MENLREEVEASVIGSMLMDKEEAEYGVSELDSSMFVYYPDIFQLFEKMHKNELNVDVQALVNEGVEGHRITAIVNSIHTSTYMKTHVKQLKEFYFTDATNAYAKKIQAATSLEERIKVMSDMPSVEVDVIKHRTSREMTQDALNKIAKRAKSASDMKGIRTYFHTFDKLTSGLYKGGVTVIDGDTNIGKSLFVENLALQIASHGKRVDYFAYEMSDVQCSERMLAISGAIPIEAINRPKQHWGAPETESANKLYNSLAIQNINFFADELSTYTFNELKTKVNKQTLIQGKKPSVIVVDYIELMDGDGIDEYDSVVRNFEALMKFAKKLVDTNIVIIMSRNKVGQMSGRNKLRFHAHMHIKLDPNEQCEDFVDCNIVKNRDGGKGNIAFLMNRKYLQFKEAEKDVQDRYTGSTTRMGNDKYRTPY